MQAQRRIGRRVRQRIRQQNERCKRSGSLGASAFRTLGDEFKKESSPFWGLLPKLKN